MDNRAWSPGRTRRIRWTALGALASGAVLLAACGSSGTAGAGSASSSGSTSSSASTSSPASGASSTPATQGITIQAATVGAFGNVLVDGSGHTLYILTSEQGGKITCTDANGCTKVWPDTELPSGVMAATAGPGIRSSLLSTVKDASGGLYVTYNGWPLYTFSGDSSAHQSNGEGITSFGGTWYVLDVSGNPVKAASGGGAGGSSSTSSGYGY